MRIFRKKGTQRDVLSEVLAADGNLKRSDIVDLIPTDLDINIPEKRREGFCVFTNTELLIGTKEKVTERIPLTDVSSMRSYRGVGCVFAEYRTKSGEDVLFARGDNRRGEIFSVFTKSFNRRMRENADAGERRQMRQKICPNCGKPIPVGKDRCPVCSSGKHLILRLLKFSSAEWKYLFVTVLLFFATTAISLISPYINRILVDDYIQKDVSSFFLAGFIGVLLSMFSVTVLRRLVGIVRGYFMHTASNHLIIRLREMVFEKIQKQSIARLSKRTAGDLMQRVGGDSARINTFITQDLPNLLEQCLVLVAVVVVMFFYDPLLATLIIVPAPFVMRGFQLFRRKMHAMFLQRLQRNDRANAVLHDIFSGIRVVKSYGMEKREEERFTGLAKSEMECQIRQEKIWAVLMPVLNFLMGCGEYILLYYVGTKMLTGDMTAGEFSQFSAYSSMVFAPFAALLRFPRQLIHVVSSLSRIYEIVDEPEDLPECDQPTELPEVKGNLSLEHVSFGYEGSSEVLHDINLEIRPGEFVGIVGRSGVGKSTLINLIMRLYEVDDGSIKLDGVDLRDISREQLHANMGVVLQETFLFAGTVWQNLIYAKNGVTREEVIHAAKVSGAHEFIVNLPDGYQTYIGERGYTLSGGERQRLAIARALLRDPKILILDEATSALDTETEKMIQDALKELAKGRTTIAIAHRLSTLRNANKLVVLEHGSVAEVGSHDELMQKNGIYASLVLAQREMTKMDHSEEEPI